jgi:hypothetical protein
MRKKNPNYNEKEARALARRKWEQTHPEQWELLKKNQRFRRRYGITVDIYEQLLEKQNGKCRICLQIPKGIHGSGRLKVLHVDHDHSTGEIRGLLCDNCNRGLGYFKDDSLLLQQAIIYLNDYNKCGCKKS